MENLLMMSCDLPPLSRWGVAKHVNQIVPLLKKQFNVELVSQSKNAINDYVTITSDEISDRLISSKLLPFDSYLDFDYLQSWNYLLAKKIIREIQSPPSIVHNHNWMTFPAARTVAKHYHAKLVSTIHFLQKQYNTSYDTLPIDSDEIIKIENDIFNQSDSIILFGEHFKQFALENYDCNKDKISIIPHGLPIVKDNGTRNHPSDSPALLFVGRLVQEKGILDLIEAVKKLTEKYPDLLLHVAGEGPLINHPSLKEGFIKYHGFLNQHDLYNLYEKADIFCFPTYTETFGLVSIEAAMHSLPVITTRDKNVEKLFVEDEALFVEVEMVNEQSKINQSQLYNNLEKLITNPQAYKFYSENARIASLRYGEETMMEHLEKLYANLNAKETVLGHY